MLAVLDLRHFSRVSVGGGHKASRASPLGRARAACFECSALVPAEHGAVGRESLLLYWIEIWKQHRPWSANTPADHYFVLGRTIAGQKQGRRFKAVSANAELSARTELRAYADFWTRSEPRAYADLWARDEFLTGAGLCSRSEPLCGC